MLRVGRLSRTAAALIAAACPHLIRHAPAAADTGYFGIAQVSVNPATPILLTGYAGRTVEATQVQQTIKAQAAAFGTGADASLLLTVDACGLPSDVVERVASAVAASHGVPRERFVLSCTHSHSCPHVQGFADNVLNPTAPQDARITQYTNELVAKLTQASIDALENRTPGHNITWGSGSVGFGLNRRGTPIAPNDHDLPLMRVTDSQGQTRAIITSYATHATTLNSGDNKVSGDWPGYARERIESLYPGAVAMVMIGAGADSNPNPRVTNGVQHAQNHGQAIADEVQRLISQNLLKPASFDIAAAHSEVDLPFATQREPGDPTNARLAPAPGSLSYGVTSWMFGDDLAMSFFEGELVVDYSLRLKAAYDDERLWVNGYSNEVQAYIPSERILYEGGYEADDASFWYALPGRFAHGIEDKIIEAVDAQLAPFYFPTDRLKLAVDMATGAVTVQNLTDADITIEAYTIASAEGRLNASANAWQSLQDQGTSGWDEADNANNSRLTEFNPTGATIVASGAAISLGKPFVPAPPTAFGQPIPTGELEFEYVTSEDETRRGVIEYTAPRNNLVLTIDPATGEATIQNESPFFDVEIDAYSIASESGLLKPGADGWSSLADQGLAGWDEASNSNADRVTEFNPNGELLLSQGGPALELGLLVDVLGGELTENDLVFQFSIPGVGVLEGIVVVGVMPDARLAGDFDGDSDVDGADFLQWQRSLGSAADPPGAGADGDGNGVVNRDDLVEWKNGFGQSAPLAASAQQVPEPSAAVVAVTLLPALTIHRPLGRRRAIA